jgi:superfamily II DNA or RNA helicase
MTGKTNSKDDENNIKRAENYLKFWKQVIIIGTIQKIWVWVDIPFIDTIFLASAIRFKATVIQSIGRGLRLHPSKTDVEVYVWNDLPILRGQRNEKEKTIKSEYKIENIIYKKLW